MRLIVVALIALAALGGCKARDDSDRPETSREFPRAFRPVSKAGSNQFSTEVARDSVNEAQTVMDLAQLAPGMTVADIGAGEGYYTVRLAQRVRCARAGAGAGHRRRGAAAAAPARRARAVGQRLDQARCGLDDPRLPDASFDRIFLVHMHPGDRALRLPVANAAGAAAGRPGYRRRSRSADRRARHPAGAAVL